MVEKVEHRKKTNSNQQSNLKKKKVVYTSWKWGQTVERKNKENRNYKSTTNLYSFFFS